MVARGAWAKGGGQGIHETPGQVAGRLGQAGCGGALAWNVGAHWGPPKPGDSGCDFCRGESRERMGTQGWDRVTLHILPSYLEAPAPGRGIASRPFRSVCVSSLSLNRGPFLLLGDPWELPGDTSLPASSLLALKRLVAGSLLSPSGHDTPEHVEL